LASDVYELLLFVVSCDNARQSGRSVAGNPDEVLKVRDVWIFEWPFAVHPDMLSSQQWLVAGRMPMHSRAERVP